MRGRERRANGRFLAEGDGIGRLESGEVNDGACPADAGEVLSGLGLLGSPRADRRRAGKLDSAPEQVTGDRARQLTRRLPAAWRITASLASRRHITTVRSFSPAQRGALGPAPPNARSAAAPRLLKPISALLVRTSFIRRRVCISCFSLRFAFVVIRKAKPPPYVSCSPRVCVPPPPAPASSWEAAFSASCPLGRH